MDQWLPRHVRIPVLIGLAVLLGILGLVALSDSTPPPSLEETKAASRPTSPLGSLLTPGLGSLPKPPPPVAVPPPELASDIAARNASASANGSETVEETDETGEGSNSRKQRYIRPFTAPNGTPWPFTSDYVDGYPKDATEGLSKVTVDNSKNPSDVFLKLVARDGDNAEPVRTVFVKAFSQFVFDEVQPGNYDLRFQNLYSGELSATAPFTLQEADTDNGKTYSNYAITLYNVTNGNMKLQPIKPKDF